MEGLEIKINKPERENVAEAVMNRAEKVKTAEMGVRRMFDEKMEAEGVIRKISEHPYFANYSERL